MNSCIITSPEGRDGLISSLFSEIMKKELTELNFLNMLQERFNSCYKALPTDECIVTFKEVLNEIISDPFVRGESQHIWLENYNPQYIDTLFDPTKDLSRQVDSVQSKTQQRDGTELIASSDTFIYSRYGSTSHALGDMQQRFNTLLGDAIFFDYATGNEVISQEQLNKNIGYYLEQLWNTICDNLPDLKLSRKSVFHNLEELERVKEYFDLLSSSAIDSLYRGSLSSPKLKLQFDAFQSFFILYNFDNLIRTYFGNLIDIDPYRFGPMVNPHLIYGERCKYQIQGLNYMSTSWGNDEEFNDVTKEASDVVKLFFDTRLLLDRNNNDKAVRTLNTREVTYIWGQIKKLQFSKSGSTSFNIQSLKNLLEDGYLTKEEYDYLIQEVTPKGSLFKQTIVKSLSDLIQDNYTNNSFVTPLIFKLLSVDTKNDRYVGFDFGFTPNQNNIIYSVYKLTFSPEAKIRKAWENRNTTDFNNQPKYYYQYLTQYFNTQSHLLMTQFELDANGNFKIKSLGKASLDRHVLYFLDKINGLFSAEVDKQYEELDFKNKIKRFEGWTLDHSKLKAGDNDSYVEVSTGDTILRIFPTTVVKLSTDGGKNFKNIDKTLNLENYSELCDLVKYVLDLNDDNFNRVVLPALRVEITDNKLVEAAANVLYNYSVSCRTINETSLNNAKDAAQDYFAIDDLKKRVKLQRNSKELNNFSTNVLTNTITPIRQTVDILNGILREASAKGADGNTINTMSTSLLIDKYQLLVSIGLNLGDDYICSDLLALNGSYTVDKNRQRVKKQGAYKGFEIARDIKTANGDNKKSCKLTPAENLAFNFVYDFVDSMFNDEGIMRTIPCIVSDKIPVIKILIDLNEEISGKKIKDLTLEEVLKITKKELGKYYQRVYEFAEAEWQKLNDISKLPKLLKEHGNYGAQENADLDWFLNAVQNGIDTKNYKFEKGANLFSLENNFNGINTLIDFFIDSNTNKIILTHESSLKGLAQEDPLYESLERSFIIRYAKDHDLSFSEAYNQIHNNFVYQNNIKDYIKSYFSDRAATAVIDLLHALEVQYNNKFGEQVAIAQNQFFVKNGIKFGVNPAIAQELFKWGIKDNAWFKAHVNEDLYSSAYKSSKEFFKIKNRQVVSDFLQSGGSINTVDRFGASITDGPIANLIRFDETTKNGQVDSGEKGSWIAGGKVVVAKLHFINSEGKENIFNITDLNSLAEINTIKDAFYNAKNYSHPEEFLEYRSISSWLNSPEFSFESLEALLKDYEKVTAAELEGPEKAQKIYEKKVANITRLLKAGLIDQELFNKLKGVFEKHKNNVKERQKLSDITIHPLFEKYNALSYLFSQEFMNSAVGSWTFHSGKDKKDMRSYCSQAYAQQTKRNVIFTATKQQFQLNELNGLPADIKMAEILNTKDLVYTIFGQEAKPWDDDGATYEGSVTNRLENNSLGGAAVGTDKKDIFWSQNPKSGINKFIKTAVHAATNYRIRDSLFYRALNYKSLVGNQREIEKFYVNGGLDITKDYNGNPINYGDFVYKRAYIGEDPLQKDGGNGINYLQFYAKDGKTPINAYNGDIVLISDIKFNPGTGMTEFMVNKSEVQSVRLKNMHDVYLFFGGAYSMNLTEELIQKPEKIKGNEYDESSIDRCVHAVNNVGQRLTQGEVINQLHVNQYLKKSIIHYFPTPEATKAGSSNPNQKRHLNSNVQLSFTTENLYDAGPQLNAEHESDESVLSMMTQVLNALGARGYTAEQANQAYLALRSLTQISLSSFFDSLSYEKLGSIDKAKSAMEDFITLVIFNSLKSGKTSANPTTLSELLLQQVYAAIAENKNLLTYDIIQKTLPIDSPTLLRELMSKISSTLVKSCIKLKFPGSMDVLSPSNGIFKLYDGRMASYYEGKDISQLPDKPVLNVADILMGATYFIPGYYEGDVVKIEDPKDYYFVKRYIQETNSPIYERVSAGRDLSSYNIRFKDTEGNSYNIWDLAVVRSSYNKNGLSKDFRKVLQNQLFALSNYYDQKTVIIDDGINQFPVTIDKSSIKIDPYEIIMSKLYQTLFGLKLGDSVKDIVEDNLFFFKRILENTSSAAPELFDVELVTIDGDNKYLVTDNVPKGFNKIEFTPVKDEAGKLWYLDYKNNPVEQLSSEEDEIYSNGKIRIIKTKNISFYLDTIKHTKVNLSSRVKDTDKLLDIIDLFADSSSKSAQYFVNKFEGFLLGKPIEDDVVDFDGDIVKHNNTAKQILGGILNGDKQFKQFLKWREKREALTLKTIKDILQDETILDKRSAIAEAAKRNKYIQHLLETSQEIHTSFLKSLEVLAARIPAQCMLSFMAMKIVGFDESGLNTAYVSRWQIYLQGSDFDIDKVSLLGFKFRNGELVKWSPYMDLSSKELLEASENLPFPTGLAVKFLEIDDDGTIENLVKATFSSYSGGSLQIGDNNKAYRLKNLAKLIIAINKFGGIPNNVFNSVELKSVVDSLKEIVDNHNLYFKNSKTNTIDALMNYVSTCMYNIGKDAANQILAEESVDSDKGAVKKIERESEKLAYAKKMRKKDAGAVTTLFDTQELTTGGKDNVGISASSLKVFEAFSQYVYNVLNNGTEREKQQLLINKEICGKPVLLIANAYQQVKSGLPTEVLAALEQVDLDTDAYLLISGFLSLSTDNAKNPILPKINADQNMIGLYLAGITLGLDLDTLIPLLTSEPAVKIASIIPANLFNGESGHKDVKAVILYIERGPKLVKVPISKKVLLASGIKTNIGRNETELQNNRKLVEDFLESPTISNLLRLPDDARLKYDSIYTQIEPSLSKTLKIKYKKSIKEIEAWGRLRDTITFGTFTLPSGERVLAYPEIKKLCYMLQEMQAFRMVAKMNLTLPNKINEVINWLRQFEGLLKSRVDTIKSLEGNMSEEALQEALSDLVKENRKLLLDQGITDSNLLDKHQYDVDFEEFLKNERYQLIVINTYDKIKFGVNIFRAMVTVPQYHGYMLTGLALVETSKSTSAVWSIANHLSKYYLNVNSSKKVREKLLSKLVDVINSSFIDEFLSTYDFGRGAGNVANPNMYKMFKEDSEGNLELLEVKEPIDIKLGTNEGNMTFKYIFEKFVIPNLKSQPRFINNELLKSLNFIKTTKTLSGDPLIKLATSTKLIPENSYEESKIADYKEGLDTLGNVKIDELGGMLFLDALYIYNLIVNQNLIRETSLTSLFEKYMLNPNSKLIEGLTDLILKFFDFQKTSQNQVLSDIRGFTGDQVDGLLKMLAIEDNGFTSGLPYIKKIDRVTGRTYLLELDPEKDLEDRSSGYSEYDENYDGGEDNDTGDIDYDFAEEDVNPDEDDSVKQSSFEIELELSKYRLAESTQDNLMILKNLSLKGLKNLTVRKSGVITSFGGLSWDEISNLERVKEMGVTSMEKLLIELGILDEEGKTIIADMDPNDLREILYSNKDCS